MCISISTGALPGTAAYDWGRVAGPGRGTHGRNQDWTVRGQTSHSRGSSGSEGVQWSHSDGQREAFTDLYWKDQTGSQSPTGKTETSFWVFCVIYYTFEQTHEITSPQTS